MWVLIYILFFFYIIYIAYIIYVLEKVLWLMKGCFIRYKKMYFTGYQIGVKYNNTSLFQKYFFTLSQGDLLMIVGGNGSGKTTLLYTILGNMKEVEGFYLLYKNKKYHLFLEDVPPPNFLNSNIDLSLNFNYNVKKTLTYWLNYNLSFFHFFLEASIKKSNLCNIYYAKYTNLSYGEKMRTHFARFLFSFSSLWALDEPYHGLDSYYVKLLNQIVLEHLNDGGILFLITHSIHSIRDMNILQL